MSDVQYAIDIAAKMTGTETTSELDRLTESLSASGKGADHFQLAIQQVSRELEAAQQASDSASTALAEGQAQYDALARAADRSAKAAEKAAQKHGGAVPPELAAHAAAAAAKLEAYSATLKGLEGTASAADSKQKQLAKTLGNVRTAAAHVDKSIAVNSERLSKLQASLTATNTPAGRLGGRLVQLVKGFSDLAGSMGMATAIAVGAAAAFAALVVAAVALAAASVAGAAAAFRWAVGLADARRSVDLTREAAEAFDPSLAGLRSTFGELTRNTSVTEDRLRGLTKELRAAKVSAADMPAALRAVALAESALGQGAASEWIAELKGGKRTVQDLAATAETKLGGVVARQMLGLDAQSARLKQNMAGVFGGLNIEGVLKGLSTLVGLFDSSTASGRAMKAAFAAVFQPIADGAQQAAWVIEAFVLGVLIGMTKLYIKMRPALDAIAELFAFERPELEDVLKEITKAGEILAPTLLAIGAVLGAVTAAVLAVGGAFAGSFLLSIHAAVSAAQTLVKIVVGVVNTIRSVLGGVDLGGVGGDIMGGLARGITGAAGAVVGAMKAAITSAIKSAKSLLGIASPSRVFAELGGYTGEGFAGGVDEAAPDAQAALANMVAPPAVELPVPGIERAAGSVGEPSAAASVSGNTFNFYGVEGAEDAVQRFGEVLTRLLEGDAAQLGGEAVPA
ncbi:MAG: hypothetical protein WDA41_08150 [Candidatus Neomarinimicrobiota bacterium]